MLLKIIQNGFAEGDWIPYLTVEYTVTKLDAPEKNSRELLWPWSPVMVPHYG